jgi:hypothetical protein
MSVPVFVHKPVIRVQEEERTPKKAVKSTKSVPKKIMKPKKAEPEEEEDIVSQFVKQELDKALPLKKSVKKKAVKILPISQPQSEEEEESEEIEEEEESSEEQIPQTRVVPRPKRGGFWCD